jgi:carboxyl-terminal processing protease
MPASQRKSSVAAIVASLVIVLLTGVWLGGHPDDLPGFARDAFVADHQARLIDVAAERIQHDYYRQVKTSELVNASITGMIADLHDRFSQYLAPREYRMFLRSSSQQFSGVGMTVDTVSRGLRVVEVFDQSPAQRAGITPGDVITAVNGRSLAHIAEDAATALIKGKPGTTVQLTLLRAGHERAVKVTRATVSVPVVASHLYTNGGKKVGWVALEEFNSGAHGEVREAIDRLLKQGARGLVFDLRDDGGGLVEEAQLVASAFLPEGAVIVTTRGRAQPTETLTATGSPIATRIPLAVLVNRATASAAEIVTAALQDHKRATVVGTHTFGKGVFQEVTQLPNGGALKITVGEYFTPSGRNLGGGGIREGAGIAPDVSVSAQRVPGRDPTLRAGLRAVAAKLR